MIHPSQLADKFFNGRCSESEAKAFLAWYFSENAENHLKKKIEAEWFDSEANEAWDEQEIFEKIQHAKKENKLFVSHKAETEVKKRRIKYLRKKKVTAYSWYAVACILILSISLAIPGFWSSNDPVEESAVTPQFIVKSNPPGQKSTIYLGDGSQVVLNSASVIKYPPRFATQNRIIYLEGEAFFKVAKDSLRPFSVVVDNTRITAIGTAFNIRSFKEEQKSHIALVSGKVQVKGPYETGEQLIYLEPGEGVEYFKEVGNLTKVTIDTEETTAWKKGVLYFNEKPIAQVVRELERWYGVNIQLSPAINGNFTGRFQNQTLKAVLEGLAYSFSLTYVINGKSVEINRKK